MVLLAAVFYALLFVSSPQSGPRPPKVFAVGGRATRYDDLRKQPRQQVADTATGSARDSFAVGRGICGAYYDPLAPCAGPLALWEPVRASPPACRRCSAWWRPTRTAGLSPTGRTTSSWGSPASTGSYAAFAPGIRSEGNGLQSAAKPLPKSPPRRFHGPVPKPRLSVIEISAETRS